MELFGLHRLGQPHTRAGEVGDSPVITITSPPTASGLFGASTAADPRRSQDRTTFRRVPSAIARAVRAATRAGLRSLQRDAALGSLGGFADAWGTAHRVPGWFGETEGAVFWSVVHEVRPATVVEIGSYLGRSTTLLGLALQHAAVPAARLVAIDPHTGDKQNMTALGISTIPTLDLFRVYTNAAGIDGLLDLRVAPSAAVAADWHDPVDLLFVDGWHSKRGVLADARGFGPHLTDGGIVCFDDYTHYKSVRRGADRACAELGLVRYGTVAAQLWAGRPEFAPAAVARAMRVERLVSAVRRLSRRG